LDFFLKRVVASASVTVTHDSESQSHSPSIHSQYLSSSSTVSAVPSGHVQVPSESYSAPKNGQTQYPKSLSNIKPSSHPLQVFSPLFPFMGVKVSGHETHLYSSSPVVSSWTRERISVPAPNY